MGQKLRAEITGSILASDQTDIRKNKFGIVWTGYPVLSKIARYLISSTRIPGPFLILS